jgi:hypothetical protein
MPVGRVNATIPISGRTNAQTLPLMALRGLDKAGVRGNPADVKKLSDADQSAADRAMAELLGLIPPESQNQKQASMAPMPTGQETMFPKNIPTQ